MQLQFESKSRVNCAPFLWWQICIDMWDMEPSGASFMRNLPVGSETGLTGEGLPGGFNQLARLYDHGVFPEPKYSVGGNFDVAGCFASAFASQVWWFWQRSVNFYGLTKTANAIHLRQPNGNYFTFYTGDSPVKRLMARQSDGLPWFTQQAKGFRFVDGTLITPWDFEVAVRGFLASQNRDSPVANKLNLSLDSAYTTSPLGYGFIRRLPLRIGRETGGWAFRQFSAWSLQPSLHHRLDLLTTCFASQLLPTSCVVISARGTSS
ncbi:MAG: hypothetical protein HC933_22460 [Pleurocapsa sp. SU_196_0]|nr:hypothetical protein [Pleurocapsa sp. SU_196_0]